jgi:protoporphyrinogen oxidase
MSRWIIGAGMTGLAAGITSGFRVLERLDHPGGICASYERDGYHFELGGGHWIFGGDPAVLRLLSGASELRSYRRRSAVLFLGRRECTRDLRGLMVPYPIQDNLFAMPKEIRDAALAEILNEAVVDDPDGTMAAWLEQQFGRTLCRVFFDLFHERYTAGLFREIAPQDAYKSPIDKARVRKGAEQENTDAGYNATFVYPARGLDMASQWLADRCDISYGTAIARIDPISRSIELDNGQTHRYDTVVATTPLNRTVEMAGLGKNVGSPDPYTSVMVLNLGVTLPDTPLARNEYHWLYIPDSHTGFHRVGYYSNVDPLFLPNGDRSRAGRGSLYIETAFPGGERPTSDATRALVAAIIEELQQSGLIDKVEAADPTWVDVAYTWRRPGSNWVSRATAACQEHGIEPAGRYGRWSFQGIAASLKEGLVLGSVLRQV